MKVLRDYRRSAFAARAFRLSLLPAVLPLAALVVYVVVDRSPRFPDETIGDHLLGFLAFYCFHLAVINFAAFIYWLGSRLPGGFPRLMAVTCIIVFVGYLWFFSFTENDYTLLQLLLIQYLPPVILMTIGSMTLLIVGIHLTLWVIDGFKEKPAAVDHNGE